MLFLDGVYVEHPAGAVRFRWINAPTSAELTELAQRIAQRVGRYLERQGLLQRDAHHRVHRRSGGDQGDPRAPGGQSAPGARTRGGHLAGRRLRRVEAFYSAPPDQPRLL